MTTTPSVSIVLLNWNRPADTIECLQSLEALDYPHFEVVVCDNASTDDSWTRLLGWAAARAPGSGHTFPSTVSVLDAPPPDQPRTPSGRFDRGLSFIQTGANRGFAAGNNVGIRYALRRGDVQYVWVLNNDTVVDPAALTALVRRCEEDSRIGMCGSTLINYDDRTTVQAYGGATFIRWRCAGEQIGWGTPFRPNIERAVVERRLDYVAGASMLVSRAFVREIGLMSEEYRLYFEEADWAERSRGRFRLGFAPDSIIYHKEGASIGTGSFRRPSLLSLYYLTLNAPRFCARFYPAWLPVVYLYLLYSVVKRAVTNHVDEARVMLRAIAGLRLEPGGPAIGRD